MNWPLFAGLAVAFTVLDASFMQVFRVGAAWPSLTPALVAFVAMWAPRSTVLWAALLAGLLGDLATPIPASDLSVIRVPGPQALGWMFGAAAILAMRRSLLRGHPAAVATSTLALLLLAALVWGAIWSARGLWPETEMPWPPGGGLLALRTRALDAGASAIAALPLAWLLARIRPWWGFPGPVWALPGGGRRP